jgi:hypothetical protein
MTHCYPKHLLSCWYQFDAVANHMDSTRSDEFIHVKQHHGQDGRTDSMPIQYSESIMLMCQDSPVTIIAFAGISQAFGGIPPFNFVRALGNAKANIIFIRDPNNKWFGNPIPDLGDSTLEMAANLRLIVDELNTNQLCLMGISSGAFAALMFAALIEDPCRVLAFSPQTCIRPSFLNMIGDSRYNQKLHGRRDSEVQDVLPLLETAINIEKIHAILGKQDPLDAHHIQRLSDLPNVVTHILGCGHNTAGYLKKRRLLQSAIDRFIHCDDQGFSTMLSEEITIL